MNRAPFPLSRFAGAVLVLSSEVAAQSSISTRVDAYSDQNIHVLAPHAQGTMELGNQRIEGGLGVDVVSGATMILETDLISSATTFEESRKEGRISVSSVAIDDWDIGATYATSIESDYETHMMGLFASVELFQAMTTLSLAANLSLEEMGRHGDPSSYEKTKAPSLDFSWSQIVDERTMLALLGSVAVLRCGARYGCQANPYRFVGIKLPGDALLPLRERHPEDRIRGAVALRGARALSDASALHLAYRLYADSWAVLGHTATASLAVQVLEDRLLLRGDARGSSQGRATFSSVGYSAASTEELPRYRSADEELSGMNSALLGGRAEWSFYGVGPFLRLGVGARGLHGWYFYELHSRKRRALILGVDVEVEL